MLWYFNWNLGVRTDHLGVWISLGTVFGLIFGVAAKKKF